MSENTAPQVIAGVSDLIFTSKISETARHVGVSVGFAGSQEALLRKAAATPALIILDLNLKLLDPVALIRDLKSDPNLAKVPITAFVNHECADLIEGAQQAGCDAVLTRGAFSSGLPEILGNL
jgi:CheY-like chemotaxis protein